MKAFNRAAILLVIHFCVLTPAFAQKGKIGAYYFDGWSGTTFHITEDLKKNFPEREPVWGWVTSEQKTVDEQIALAADAGLSFFSFCWYFKKGGEHRDVPNNRALSFYKNSKNVKRLEYCLLVANHAGYDITPENWTALTAVWLDEFRHPQYLRVGGKPLIVFFESGSLVRNFGSEQSVREAFATFKKEASEAGLAGVSIAICAGSPEGVTKAEACGADVITGYNYHSIGFKGNAQAIPIDSLHHAEPGLWSKLATSATMPYIPVSTIGWDPRPWANDKNKYLEKPYFTGFSAKSVEHSVTGLKRWIAQMPTG
ncbi:hypothetical protein SAMN05216327_106411 [Dyadobacter sp. SG02]|uniref:hypothetical protein n=1 Tax=Dyadobacter sp. SG02 TaxID=1855291 RepID=UPI0008BE01AA|nr:hypothetical protein [Dyadobacter sp. SG02]SEJ16214.1 hypothetical protein SAMN05216327_106411 [Dyadobacter sp. SG02]